MAEVVTNVLNRAIKFKDATMVWETLHSGVASDTYRNVLIAQCGDADLVNQAVKYSYVTMFVREADRVLSHEGSVPVSWLRTIYVLACNIERTRSFAASSTASVDKMVKFISGVVRNHEKYLFIKRDWMFDENFESALLNQVDA